MGFLAWLKSRRKAREAEQDRRAAYLRERIYRHENIARSHLGRHVDVQYALSPNDAKALTGRPHALHTFFRYDLANGASVRIRVAPIADEWISEGLIIHDPAP